MKHLTGNSGGNDAIIPYGDTKVFEKLNSCACVIIFVHKFLLRNYKFLYIRDELVQVVQVFRRVYVS